MSDLAPYIGVDLSNLPAPEMIEQVDYNAVFTNLVTDFTNRDPSYTILLESDPAIKLLEVEAYREHLLRQDFNDRAEQLLLAFATGRNLEQLAARVGLKREIVIPANDRVVPATAAVYQTDDVLRQLVQLAAENYNTAGSPGAYLFHMRAASVGVYDARVYNHSSGLVKPGGVMAVVMVADGFDTKTVVSAVHTRLFREDVKPLTDNIRIVAAKPEAYEIKATVYVRGGPSLTTIRSDLSSRLSVYLSKQKRINRLVSRSGIIGALQADYVDRVALDSPSADFFPSLTGYAQASASNVRIVTLV